MIHPYHMTKLVQSCTLSMFSTFYCPVLVLTPSFVTMSFQETHNILLCHLRWAASSRFISAAVNGICTVYDGVIKLLTCTVITLLLSLSCRCSRFFFYLKKTFPLRTLHIFTAVLPSTAFHFMSLRTCSLHFKELQKVVQFILLGLNNDSYVCKCYADVVFAA